MVEGASRQVLLLTRAIQRRREIIRLCAEKPGNDQTLPAFGQNLRPIGLASHRFGVSAKGEPQIP